MNFLRLSDPLLAVLFEDDDIIAIDKPYGFNAHTNDSKSEHGAAVEDGLIEIYEKQLRRKLHIIHRLDQTTTGVMIFGKSLESAKTYSEYFFNREVKKTYWFITKNVADATEYFIDKEIVHKGKNLEASTDLKLLKSSGSFNLWQAKPHTGRNHQIRIHAQAAGLSILGDGKYEGAEFPFLCLHNHQIQFPNGLSITTRPPVYFETLEWLNDPELSLAFFEIDRRNRFFQFGDNKNACFRWVHNKNGSEEPGYTLDHYGQMLILNWYRPKWILIEENKFRLLSKTLGLPILVYVVAEKRKILIESPMVNAKVKDHWVCEDNGILVEIRCDSGLSTGVILNQRLQRNWVRGNASGASVLSLFGYTGGYAVSAAKGGAREITVVESSKNSLEWAKKNALLNQVSDTSIKFLCRDSLSYIEQCALKNVKYDLIVCDTPTFYRREKSVFRIEKDLEGLLKILLDCLTEQGLLLLATQFDAFYINDLRQLINKAQKSNSLGQLEIQTVLPSLDFELPDQKANLKSFLIKKIKKS